MVLADYGADDPPISSPSIFYVLIVGSFISHPIMSVSMCTSISKTNSFPPFQGCLCVEKLEKTVSLLEDIQTTSPKIYRQ